MGTRQIVVPDYRWERMLRRFWSKVSKGDPDSCWEWIGRVSGCPASADQATKVASGGQGVWEPSSGSTVPAARSSYLIANELRSSEIRGCPVRQACGNRLCVNPAHLTLGAKGSHLIQGKLTQEQVQTIRAQGEAGRMQADIADEFDVTRATVSRIVARKVYKDVGDADVYVSERPHRRSKVPSPTSLIDNEPGSPLDAMAAELNAGRAGLRELQGEPEPQELPTKLIWHPCDRGGDRESRSKCGRYVVWLQGSTRHGNAWANEWGASLVATMSAKPGAEASWLSVEALTVAGARETCQEHLDGSGA